MILRVFTTVGVSLFENYRRKHRSKDIDKTYKALKDTRNRDWEGNQSRIERLRTTLSRWVNGNDNACAEIKSVIKIVKREKSNCCVHLLASDTIISRLAAEIIEDELHERQIDGFTVEAHFDPDKDVIKDLQVGDRKLFEKEGLVNLVEYLNLGYFEDVIFNITGGYKGVIPYLSLMAMVNSVPLYYIFEDTDELIKIPQVPVDINWGMFEKYAYVLERLEEGIMDWPQFKREHNIGEDFQACFWEEDGLAGLNAIGKVFWERFKKFIVIKVPRGFSLFSDKPGNRRQVEKAINQLYKRLMDVIDYNGITSQEQLLGYIKGLSEQDDLRHATNPGRNLFIFKYTDVEHVRLVYRPVFRRGDLSLIVCDYSRGRDIVHEEKKYIIGFQKKWSDFRDSQIEDFDTIPIKKEGIN